MPDIDEGTPVSVPPIPSAARAFGITETTMDQAVRTAPPPKHWAAGMRPGETRIVNGAVYQREPVSLLAKGIMVELPADRQPDVEVPSFDNMKIDSAKVAAVNRSVVAQLAMFNGRSLDAASKAKLGEIYTTAHDQAQKIVAQAVNGATPSTRDSSCAQLANIAATALLGERALFAGNEKAQTDRYGRPLIAQARSTPAQNELEKALVSMLRGDYMTQPARSSATEPAALGERIATAVGTWGTAFRIAVPDAMNRPQTTFTTEVAKSSPSVLGYEVRLYLAEHDTADTPWEEEFGIDGIVHTSVLGGIWVIQQQDFEVQTHQSDVGMTASPFVRRQLSRLISTRTERRTTAVFVGWNVANGCASTYLANDDLTLFYSGFFASYAAAIHWLKGCTPAADGKYYPIRSCAYPVGNYGVHWVCHQAANAFCYRKWGLIPVQYIISHLLFGTFGLLGISPRLDVVDQKHYGCIPGSHCFYNVMLGYADPALALLEEPFMSGDGYGLDEFWNSRKSIWASTNASYHSKVVPIPGWNEVEDVQVLAVPSPQAEAVHG